MRRSENFTCIRLASLTIDIKRASQSLERGNIHLREAQSGGNPKLAASQKLRSPLQPLPRLIENPLVKSVILVYSPIESHLLVQSHPGSQTNKCTRSQSAASHPPLAEGEASR
jgi:hypothetical protein